MLLAVASRVQVSSCRTIRAAKVAKRAAISLVDLADLVDDAEMASAEHPSDAEGEGAPARRQDDLLDRAARQLPASTGDDPAEAASPPPDRQLRRQDHHRRRPATTAGDTLPAAKTPTRQRTRNMNRRGGG